MLADGLGQQASNLSQGPVETDASKGYNFDGSRGYCFACKIDLTSVAHANQHLPGRKHLLAVERWKREGEMQSYPLYCDICFKPFTGQVNYIDI